MSQPLAPRRVVVVGNTASGKSTLADRLARRYGLVHLELDAFAHQAGWQIAEPEAFRAAVQERMAHQGWVADGNWLSYTTHWLWPQADTIVWIDLPLWRVLPRLIRRSLRRILTRQELWNGNREGWSALIGRHSLVIWAITSQRRKAEQLPALLTDARAHGAAAVRLRSPRQLRRWWDSLPSGRAR